MSKHGFNGGFTLIELITTLSIVAITATIAVPNYLTFVQNNRLAAQINSLVTSLNVARSEAVKRLTPPQVITICASSNGTSCNTTQWEQGWIVFLDLNADATTSLGGGTCTAADDCILQVSGALQGGNTLRTTGFPNAGSVQFNSRGAPTSAGTFRLCDKRGAVEARAANVNFIGRVSQGVDSNNDSIVENMAGTNVSCP